MKITYHIFVAGMILSTGIFADNLASYEPQPAAQQSYHSVNSPAPSDASSIAALPIATPPAAAPAAPAAAQPSVSQALPVDAQTEMATMAQNTLSFEQSANQRIQDLSVSNHAMGTAIETLMQNVMQLQQQIRKEKGMEGPSFLTVFADPEKQGMFLGALGMLLLCSGIAMGRFMQNRSRFKKPIPKTASPAPVTDAEYDFMSTTQAIPAKLDLARSYIAMNDAAQAKAILKTVLEKGDEFQKCEARSLMEMMESVIRNP